MSQSQPSHQQINGLLAYIEQQARAATVPLELAFSIANDSYNLLGFRQALVVARQPAAVKLMCVSGVAMPSEDSPYLLWLRRHLSRIVSHNTEPAFWLTSGDMFADEPASLPSAERESLVAGWQEWWPVGAYIQTLADRQGEPLGWVIFLLDNALQPWQQAVLPRLAATWGYSWEMLAQQQAPAGVMSGWRGLKRKSWWLTLALIVVLCLPVRLSVLAPAEVIALSSQLIAAPLDGVIERIAVRPGDTVVAGQLLFSFDDTSLKNRLAVMRQSVAVADAQYIAASQSAFTDAKASSELAFLKGRAQEKRAELAAIQVQLDRVQVLAPHDGQVVFSDTEYWLGRPVSTGERIMLLADTAQPGLSIHLALGDAIQLAENAKVSLFLKTDPLHPLSGELIESNYQSVLSPEGIASYRLRAAFTDNTDEDIRLGLQGTAKLYGNRVLLGYYLLRRPLAGLREWTGW